MKKVFSILLFSVVLWISSIHAQGSEKAYDIAAKAYQMQNHEEAERIWTDLALSGNANAQYALAIMHLKKETKDPNDKAAYDLLTQASAQQHVVAMFNLGVAYWEGTGTPINQSKALNWWEIAAQKHDSGAQYNLGLAYYIGAGRKEDADKAYYWVTQAAQNGHPQAPTLLSSMTAPSEISSATDKAASKNATATADVTKVTEDTLGSQTQEASAAAESENTAEVVSAKPKSYFFKSTNTITQLHSQANIASPIVSILKSGTLIQKIETSGDWTKVQTPKGAAAWVYETFVNIGSNSRGNIIGSNVNVRPTPSTDNATSAPITRLNDGDRVQILVTRSPWVKILAEQPIPAWIQTKHIEKYADTTETRMEAWLTQSK